MRAEVLRFDGTDGLDSLARTLAIDVPDRTSFQARVMQAGLSPTLFVDDISISPASRVRLHSELPLPRFVFLLMTVEGRYRVVSEEVAVDARPGEAVLVDTGTPVHFESSEPVRLLRLVVGLEDLPPQLRSGAPLPVGAIPGSALLSGLRAFSSSVLADLMGDARPTPHLVRAMQDLLVGVIDEARGAISLATSSEGTRQQIKQLIEQRLGDRSLGPSTIAAALGVSVRYVHRVFELEDETISRYIEHRRIRAITARLWATSSRVRVTELAWQFGFTGSAQLNRAFRRRYGITVEQYRNDVGRYRV